jgi:hypothetical protein
VPETTEPWETTTALETTVVETTVVETTAPPLQVEGTEPAKSGVLTCATYWWFKAKVVISSPNPGSKVKIEVQAAGALKGSGSTTPPENVGPVVSIEGEIVSGAFSGSSAGGSVGNTRGCAIGHMPSSTGAGNRIDAVIRIDGIDIATDYIEMWGVVYCEEMSGGVAIAKLTGDYDWKVKVEKK